MVRRERMLSFVIFMSAFMLANCGLFTQNITAQNDTIENRLFKRVEYAAERGNVAKAKDNVKRVLKLNPQHKGALFYAGVILFDKGNRDAAKVFFSKVVSSSKYGSRAREYLSELKLYGIRKRFSSDLNKKIVGESYRDALAMCEEGLAVKAGDARLLFSATYVATMAGLKQRAEGYLARFLKFSTQDIASAELKSFVEAWFARGYNAQDSIDKLFILTDKRLLRRPVMAKIRELIVELKQLDKFEELIEREKKEPGANISKLERDLINFYIDLGMNKKALRLINERPVDSIEDNVLYIKLLNQTKREKKAMLIARRLLGSSRNDLRLYKAWVESYLAFYKRTEKPPQGLDEGGLSFEEMASSVLKHIKFEMLVEFEAKFLLDLLRISIVIDDKKSGLKIISQAVNITYSDQLTPKLIETVDELIVVDQNSFAIQILESAFNQLQDNLKLQIKLADLYYLTDRVDEAKSILDSVLETNPDSIHAFMTWVDCMSVLGKSDIAEKALLTRLDDPNLLHIVKRQLDAKLATIRMGGGQVESESKVENDE